MPVVNHGNPRLPISSFQVVVRNTFLELEDDVFDRRITPPFLFPVRPWKKGTGNKLIKLQTLREWERERETETETKNKC